MTDIATRTVGGRIVPEQGSYAIDVSHSAVEFVVRHLGLAKVRGRFARLEGTIDVAEAVTDSSVAVTIEADSIDTGEADRDAHLRSGDFLDVESHPTLAFRSTGVREDGDRWLVDGDLTITGTTKPVTLEVDVEGGARDPWGFERVGFNAETKINREDFGLTWNQALETGGWLVGKEVKIELTIQAVKQG